MKFCLLVKKVVDFLTSFFILLITSPLLLVCVLLIRIETPGKALFKQARVGKDGKIFTMYKLRTLRSDAPVDVPSELLETRYITKIGRFLRKTSIDELPQFFNVLRGDMSLVGPRPIVPAEEEFVALRKKLGVYRMLPGITGWAQINGRDSISYEKKAMLDAYYVKNWSPLLDVRIFFQSIIPVICGKDIKEGQDDES